jgi:hypothetical protein
MKYLSKFENLNYDEELEKWICEPCGEEEEEEMVEEKKGLPEGLKKYLDKIRGGSKSKKSSKEEEEEENKNSKTKSKPKPKSKK